MIRVGSVLEQRQRGPGTRTAMTIARVRLRRKSIFALSALERIVSANAGYSHRSSFFTMGVSSDGAGGARRGPCCWSAPRPPPPPAASPHQTPGGNAGGTQVGAPTPRARVTRARGERGEAQLEGPKAPAWAASEERAATSVRRAGGEATLRALLTRRVPNLVTLRGGRRACDELEFLRRAAQSNFS